MIKETKITIRQLSFAALAAGIVSLPFSVAICHTSLIVFLILWIFEGSWNGKIHIIKENILLQIIIAFAVLQLVGLFYTDMASDGQSIAEKKVFLFLMPIALATSNQKFNTKEIRLLLYFFVAACFAGTIICLGYAAWQTEAYFEGEIAFSNIGYLDSSYFREFNPSPKIPWFFFSYIGLAGGINLHPSYFSLYLAFCIIFLMHELITGEYQHLIVQRNVSMVVILLFSIVIVLLSSRIIILSLFTLYFFISIFWLYKRRSLAQSIYIIVLLISISVLLYINPVSRYRNLQEYTRSGLTIRENTIYKTSAEIRASLWWLGWKTYTHNNLFFGAGTGDVKAVMKQTSEKYEVTNTLESYDPHNQFLFTLIANGIIGLVSLILWFCLPFMIAFFRQDYFYAAFTFLFAALCLTESALELQKGIVFFAIVHPLLAFQRQSFQNNLVTLKFFGARN